MCDNCEDLCETIGIKHPHEYFNLINQIKQMIKDSILDLVDSNCDFWSIENSKPIPVDVPSHIFECTRCKQKFFLSVETYHGGGGNWEAKGLENTLTY